MVVASANVHNPGVEGAPGTQNLGVLLARSLLLLVQHDPMGNSRGLQAGPLGL